MPALFFGGKKVELPDCIFPSNIKKWLLEKWKFWREGTAHLFPLFAAVFAEQRWCVTLRVCIRNWPSFHH